MTLAIGQLAATEGDLLVSGGNSAVVSMMFFNGNTATETVKIFLQVSGGTSYQIMQKDIPANDTLLWESDSRILLESGDKIRGLSTTAAKVNFAINYLTL